MSKIDISQRGFISIQPTKIVFDLLLTLRRFVN
ncbi:Uncharacterised protein [Vibrio cholerae]|nr:Uncharacterised protein [Vibrio cholerae]